MDLYCGFCIQRINIELDWNKFQKCILNFMEFRVLHNTEYFFAVSPQPQNSQPYVGTLCRSDKFPDRYVTSQQGSEAWMNINKCEWVIWALQQ